MTLHCITLRCTALHYIHTYHRKYLHHIIYIPRCGTVFLRTTYQNAPAKTSTPGFPFGFACGFPFAFALAFAFDFASGLAFACAALDDPSGVGGPSISSEFSPSSSSSPFSFGVDFVLVAGLFIAVAGPFFGPMTAVGRKLVWSSDEKKRNPQSSWILETCWRHAAVMSTRCSESLTALQLHVAI